MEYRRKKQSLIEELNNYHREKFYSNRPYLSTALLTISIVSFAILGYRSCKHQDGEYQVAKTSLVENQNP